MLPTIRYRTPTIRPVIRPATSRQGEPGSDFDRLFDGLFGPSLWSSRVTRGYGAANLYETDERIVLELEVPGFTKEEIEVTVERGVLTVSGSHEEGTPATEEGTPDTEEAEEGVVTSDEPTYHVRERSFKRFSRAFTLPESVGLEAVLAELDNGVLTVRLPKAAEARPRRIEISER